MMKDISHLFFQLLLDETTFHIFYCLLIEIFIMMMMLFFDDEIEFRLSDGERDPPTRIKLPVTGLGRSSTIQVYTI